MRLVIKYSFTILFVLSLLGFLSDQCLAKGGGARGGGSRGGGGIRSGGSSGSRSGGSASTSRFRYPSGSGGRSGSSLGTFRSSSSSGYRYGSYSGYRYGTAMRRTVYWPIYSIYFGSRYRYNSRPNYQYVNYTLNNATTAITGVAVSDTFLKTKQSDNDTIYQCGSDEYCCEPINNLTDLLGVYDSYEYGNFVDGACCDNTDNSSSGPICCVVSLYSKASALKHIWISSLCILISSFLLVRRLLL